MNQDARNRIAESVIVITMLVAAWFVLARPFQDRAERAAAQVGALEAELESYKASVDLPPEQAQRYLDRVDRLVSLASPSAALADHERILGFARQSGLEIDRLNPTRESSPTRVGPIVTDSRRFQVESDGTFAQLASFLSALSTRAPMTVVEHFSLHAPDSHNPEKLVLEASVRVGSVVTQRLDVAEVMP